MNQNAASSYTHIKRSIKNMSKIGLPHVFRKKTSRFLRLDLNKSTMLLRSRLFKKGDIWKPPKNKGWTCFCNCLFTLPETNSSPLKTIISNRNLLFQGSIFRGYVSFREGSNWKEKSSSFFQLRLTSASKTSDDSVRLSWNHASSFAKSIKTTKQKPMCDILYDLVGGFNPFEKY